MMPRAEINEPKTKQRGLISSNAKKILAKRLKANCLVKVLKLENAHKDETNF